MENLHCALQVTEHCYKNPRENKTSRNENANKKKVTRMPIERDTNSGRKVSNPLFFSTENRYYRFAPEKTFRYYRFAPKKKKKNETEVRKPNAM